MNFHDPSKTLAGIALISLSTLLLSFAARKRLFYLLQKWKYADQTVLKDYSVYFIIGLLSLVIIFLICIYNKDTQLCLISSLVICLSFVVAIMNLVNLDDIDLVKSQDVKRSIGALWAHGAYNSYYKVMFQEWSNVVKEYEAKGKQLTSRKLILICPSTCNIQGKLSERFDDVEEVDILEFTAFDQGANINREYKSPVYKFGRKGNEIFISTQFPSSYGTLWEVKEDTLRKDVWLYHRDCFNSTLKELLKDSPCNIFEYNDFDNEEPLDRFILRKLNVRKEN